MGTPCTAVEQAVQYAASPQSAHRITATDVTQSLQGETVVGAADLTHATWHNAKTRKKAGLWSMSQTFASPHGSYTVVFGHKAPPLRVVTH